MWRRKSRQRGARADAGVAGSREEVTATNVGWSEHRILKGDVREGQLSRALMPLMGQSSSFSREKTILIFKSSHETLDFTALAPLRCLGSASIMHEAYSSPPSPSHLPPCLDLKEAIFILTILMICSDHQRYTSWTSTKHTFKMYKWLS